MAARNLELPEGHAQPRQRFRPSRDPADAREAAKAPPSDFEDADRKIAECFGKLAGCRAAFDSGANGAAVVGRIAEIEADADPNDKQRSSVSWALSWPPSKNLDHLSSPGQSGRPAGRLR